MLLFCRLRRPRSRSACPPRPAPWWPVSTAGLATWSASRGHKPMPRPTTPPSRKLPLELGCFVCQLGLKACTATNPVLADSFSVILALFFSFFCLSDSLCLSAVSYSLCLCSHALSLSVCLSLSLSVSLSHKIIFHNQMQPNFELPRKKKKRFATFSLSGSRPFKSD